MELQRQRVSNFGKRPASLTIKRSNIDNNGRRESTSFGTDQERIGLVVELKWALGKCFLIRGQSHHMGVA
jgi:hypothetical protein